MNYHSNASLCLSCSRNHSFIADVDESGRMETLSMVILVKETAKESKWALILGNKQDKDNFLTET